MKREAKLANLPNGSIAFTNCSIQIAKLPSFLFEKLSDQRKRKQNGRTCREVLGVLGGFANPDGTNVYPSGKTVGEVLNFSRTWASHLITRLVELGYVIPDGYAYTNGKRTVKRRLVLPVEAQKALGLTVADTELSDNDRDPSDNDRKSSDNSRVDTTRHSFDPPMYPPVLPAETETAEKLESGLVEILSQAFPEKVVSRVGLDKVLVAAKGIDNEKIRHALKFWLRTRDLGGLEHPFVMFAKELSGTLAAIDEKAKDEALAKNLELAGEWVRKLTQWLFADVSEPELDAWVKANPPPKPFLLLPGPAEQIDDLKAQNREHARAASEEKWSQEHAHELF